MRRVAQLGSCACPDCAPARPVLDRACLAVAAIAFALLPGRALLHLAGIL